MWFGIAGVFAAGIGFMWAFPFKSGTLSSIHRLLHGQVNPEDGSARISIWQNVLRLVPERLLFGGGPDTLADRIQFSFQEYNEATGTNIQAFIDTAHNDYLNILVNTGLFSLLAYLAALVSAARRAVIKAATNNHSACDIRRAAVLSHSNHFQLQHLYCVPVFLGVFRLAHCRLP